MPTPDMRNLAMNHATEADDFSGWLMYHSVGVYPGHRKAMTEALAAFAANWCAPDDSRWDAALAARAALLSDWAGLIGANEANVFGAQNVTDAFARFLDGLADDTLRGRTVLVAADCFPSLHFLLSGLAPRRGFTLRTVAVREGEDYVRDEDFIDAWTGDVALALVTWVSSLTSKRVNLPGLCEHARRRESLVALDVTQGIGILPFDLSQTPFDFVCGSTLKWLCGAPGTGLGYIAPHALAQGATPAVRGWFSQEDPFNWNIHAFTYASDARRFDTGTPSVLPFVASQPGMTWMRAQPPGSVRRHNLALCHRLIDMLDERGYRLLSPRNDNERGASIMAEAPAHLDAAQLVAQLKDAGIFVDARSRTLRFSPGICTTRDGIDSLAQCLPR
ncbi:aminotransferase class V-fold PLP-dependent enzyme [Paraburkholderia sp. MM5384-R2]|uniref:aminotransferase class V-fold PLP-dependent enzyme n=1 Tax=Paraburkholderia sp. MM5384-R2 TaxID=2723097 RepID=UPI0017E52C28|nr:aminotransferase class V-fold PLP-dependent enzyme [Paraburkholderia sp. MM5384-R2]MBB5499345.1 selenocysteine lyase/cysteine desulfurase [Paraburkholderia sp. MM5384-R2]